MKKLFSYLLISSMVVLSSCTNYDDQFDDLNTQINTLKSQIEGFSSLSSGLTALQGTVASLQTAIANIPVTPATDISGLESTQAALTAALTSLAADVKALQDTLATAATAAEVAALQTALAAAQSDLTDLLAANNVYTPGAAGLVINTAATLAFAESLGDKLTIVNGDVHITQTSTAMDAAKLQAVASKFVTITGDINYTHSGTGVTAVNFDKLASVTDGTFTQLAPFSAAALASADDLVVTADAKVTSVSLPALVSVGSLSDGTVDSFDFSSATSIDLKSLVRYPNTSLTFTTKSTGTIDLAALTTTNATDGKQKDLTLSITGPKVVTLSTYETGSLTTDAETVTLPKAIEAPSFTAANLKELHMHNLQGAITLTGFSQVETLDIIGTYVSTGVAADVTGLRATDVKITTATSLTDLDLAGALGAVEITGAGNLTSVTTSGGMRSFKLTGATDLTSLTLGHGPNASSTKKRSDLIVTGATNLESLTADSINNASVLTISSNPKLATISLAGLKAVSTETVTEAVSITGNALVAQSVQLPSPTGITPVVAGKVTTNSGITALKTYLDAVIATSGETAYVKFDNVTEIVDHLGEKFNADTATKTKATGLGTGNNETISTVANAGWVFISTSPGSAAPASVKETRTYVMAAPSAPVGDNFVDGVVAAADDLSIYADGIDHSFEGGTATGEYATMTALVNAINAFDFGGTTVTAARDAQKVLKSRLSYTKAGVATSITNIVAADKFIFKLGTVTKTYTNPTNVASSLDGISMTELGTIIANTMTGTVVSGKKYNVGASGGVLTITGLITNTESVDYGNITYPSFSIVVTNTTGYQSLGASTNTAAAMTASSVAIGASNVTVNGLRITLQNDSFSTAFDSNDDVTGAGNFTVTTVVSGTHTYGNSSWVIPFSSAVNNSAGGTAAGVVDATAWL